MCAVSHLSYIRQTHTAPNLLEWTAAFRRTTALLQETDSRCVDMMNHQ